MGNAMKYFFIPGAPQHVFEQQQVIIDFKSMTEIKTLSRKQKKIKRRPKFSCKDPHEHHTERYVTLFVSFRDIANDHVRQVYKLKEYFFSLER